MAYITHAFVDKPITNSYFTKWLDLNIFGEKSITVTNGTAQNSIANTEVHIITRGTSNTGEQYTRLQVPGVTWTVIKIMWLEWSNRTHPSFENRLACHLHGWYPFKNIISNLMPLMNPLITKIKSAYFTTHRPMLGVEIRTVTASVKVQFTSSTHNVQPTASVSWIPADLYQCCLSTNKMCVCVHRFKVSHQLERSLCRQLTDDSRLTTNRTKRSQHSQECKDPRRQRFCDSWPRPKIKNKNKWVSRTHGKTFLWQVLVILVAASVLEISCGKTDRHTDTWR